MRMGCPPVVAPFAWQPGRDGLRGLASLGVSSTASSAAKGAAAGASIGSAVPIVGTAVGAIAGAIGGAIASAFNRNDQEVGNFNQAVALWQANPNAVYNIVNKYLVLAGLFDLKLDHACSSRWCIPMYVKYGRMGEQPFVTDMVRLIYNAAQNGQITANDTPLTIMSRIVQPWIDSWGYGPMIDPHADMIQRILVGMIADYVGGNQRAWSARSGDYPFASLPAFSLPQQTAQTPTLTPTPVIGPVGSSATTPLPITTPSPAAPISTGIGPVGSSAAPSPAQLVASPPALGTLVNVAPDMAQGGIPVQVPAGLVFAGLDPNNRSWILQPSMSFGTGQKYVLWQGSILPYSASTFTAAGAINPVAGPPTVPLPQIPSSSPTVATTSTGAPVTQTDLQALASQLAAQGQSAQQAFTSALQTLQSNGVAATPQVQAAVQSAVQAAPTAAPASVSAAGFGSSMLNLTTGEWLTLGAVGVMFWANRKPGRTRARRR